MDGREGMALHGSAPYYLHRGISGSQPGLSTPSGGYANRPSSNPNVPSQPNARTSSSVGPTFNVEAASPQNVAQGFTITMSASGGLGGGGGLSSGELGTKKKRGRPRKYGPDGSGGGGNGGSSMHGNVSLGLSTSTPNSSTVDERRKRGRPRGSGRKQRLASVGEWMNNTAGIAFTPHIIHVAPGEDIAAKILAFAQQRSRAICIMSGSGGVSAVTLRQPASSGGTVTFEGRFEILCLSGSYLVAESGGARDRIGGVNVSLSSSDGHVIGGAVGGRLIASKQVQVVACSFVYGNAKGKSKEPDTKDDKGSDQNPSNKASAPMNTQNAPGSWRGSKGGVDPNTNIDLASG